MSESLSSDSDPAISQSSQTAESDSDSLHLKLKLKIPQCLSELVERAVMHMIRASKEILPQEAKDYIRRRTLFQARILLSKEGEDLVADFLGRLINRSLVEENNALWECVICKETRQISYHNEVTKQIRLEPPPVMQLSEETRPSKPLNTYFEILHGVGYESSTKSLKRIPSRLEFAAEMESLKIPTKIMYLVNVATGQMVNAHKKPITRGERVFLWRRNQYKARELLRERGEYETTRYLMELIQKYLTDQTRGQWKCGLDERSRRVYYIDSKTQIKTWKSPPATHILSPPQAKSPKLPQKNFEEFFNELRNEIYKVVANSLLLLRHRHGITEPMTLDQKMITLSKALATCFTEELCFKRKDWRDIEINKKMLFYDIKGKVEKFLVNWKETYAPRDTNRIYEVSTNQQRRQEKQQPLANKSKDKKTSRAETIEIEISDLEPSDMETSDDEKD